MTNKILLGTQLLVNKVSGSIIANLLRGEDCMKCLGKYAYKHIGEIIGVNTYIDERPPQGAALASYNMRIPHL